MKLPNVNTITQQEFLDHIEDDDFYMWKWLSQFLVITRVRTKDERGYPDWQRTLSDSDVERAIAILNRDNKAVIEQQF